MPSPNMSLPVLSEETSISLKTLYNWRQKATSRGDIVSADGKNSEKQSAADKFATVLETTSFHEVELGEYCLQKGL